MIREANHKKSRDSHPGRGKQVGGKSFVSLGRVRRWLEHGE